MKRSHVVKNSVGSDTLTVDASGFCVRFHVCEDFGPASRAVSATVKLTDRAAVAAVRDQLTAWLAGGVETELGC